MIALILVPLGQLGHFALLNPMMKPFPASQIVAIVRNRQKHRH